MPAITRMRMAQESQSLENMVHTVLTELSPDVV